MLLTVASWQVVSSEVLPGHLPDGLCVLTHETHSVPSEICAVVTTPILQTGRLRLRKVLNNLPETLEQVTEVGLDPRAFCPEGSKLSVSSHISAVLCHSSTQVGLSSL